MLTVAVQQCAVIVLERRRALRPVVEAIDGYRLRRDHRRIFAADTCAGRRLRGARAQEMTWAYALSGAVALALLVYLVVALFRAEDL
jgi:K+-transporting ATPase KdpF subunit